MITTRKLANLFAVMLMGSALTACMTETDVDELNLENGVRLTVIHTGDIHSRLLPYDMDLMATDERIGMVQSNEPFGGIARAATVIKSIRRNAQHIVHVDSGDVFQGAPIFNEFSGEPEILALNHLGLDVFIIGNHEFDEGPFNLYDKLSKAQFAVLAANYQWRNTQGLEIEPLKNAARPYTVVNTNGLKVAVIGMANFSSMSSITYGDNGLGITVLENVQVVQSYIDLLKQDANVMTMVTHLGLGEDEDVIRKTTGLDVVFGGHLHIVLNPPKNIPDATVNSLGEDAPRMVPLVHSGAFMKYVGHFEGVFYPDHIVHPENYVNRKYNAGDMTLVSHLYAPVPIESDIVEDADLAFVIAPYEYELARRLDLRKIVGYAPQTLRRFGTGGNDSMLGNFLADNMVMRQRVEADFGATNSLGIRTDVNQGPVTNDQLYNVFPFPNSVTSMTLSGSEVWALLDFNSYRSMNRGCQSQLQVSGVRYTLDCHTAKRVVDDYLDMGFLFEFQYRVDAYKLLCAKTPKPSYCQEDGNVHFAKDIKLVRGACKTDSDCAFHEQGISKCETIEDSEVGEYKVCLESLQPNWSYKFATNNYMAHGGSGFSSLKYNTTQKDTGVELRAVSIDGIESNKTCYDRCADQLGEEFDPNNLGKCKQLVTCKADIFKYEKRWCQSTYKYSDQEVCIEQVSDAAASCIGLSKETQYDICLTASYQSCSTRYYKADIATCLAEMEEVEGKCAQAAQDSEYSRCVAKFTDEVGNCIYLNAESEYERCVSNAEKRAEGICTQVACFVASTDGRQKPERPRNEKIGEDISNISSFSNGPAIMEALQNAGYDACY